MIIPAKREHLKDIMTLIESGIDRLKRDGIPQWQNGYPNQSVIESDLSKGHIFVCVREGRLVGTMSFLFGIEPTYQHIENGQWTEEKPYATIHRMATDPDHGRGAATEMFDFAFSEVERKGAYAVRVDTHEKNARMRRTLTKNGFEACGIVTMKDHSKRIAYERLVEGQMSLRRFHELSHQQLYDCLRLRQRIFIIEQNCPYEDIDGIDVSAHTILLTKDDQLIGTARVFLDQTVENTTSLGRFVVDANHRGKNYGKRLVTYASQVATDLYPATNQELHGQAHLQRFYESLGFSAVSDVYLIDDIPHLTMVKRP